MKYRPSKPLLVMTGAIIFNIIFWNEKLGINLAIFDIFICGSIVWLYPHYLHSKGARWLLLGHLITSATVVIENTQLSKVGYSITLLLFISFSQYLHRSVWYAAGSALQNMVLALPNFFREWKAGRRRSAIHPRGARHIRLLLIPFFIVAVFIVIYAAANTVFSKLVMTFGKVLDNGLMYLYDWFSLERSAFFALGILTVSALVLSCRKPIFSAKDMQQENELKRRKNRYAKWRESAWSDLYTVITGRISDGILALKSEYAIAALSLLLLNGLLLVVNVIDVRFVWMGYSFDNAANTAVYVHEGAWLLIGSIICAMLLLLFFYRGNLNFYKKNKWLRYSTYGWIVQNAFLVFSVGKRDFYYISIYGLAYKRVGLLFFLSMVLFGLGTVFLKIFLTKTNYYLWRLNAWAGIGLLVIASVVNWDETIARYNLDRINIIKPDVQFLLSLSDKTLPLLQANEALLKTGALTGRQYLYAGESFTAEELFQRRKADFFARENAYTWLSWNMADETVKKELKKKAAGF